MQTMTLNPTDTLALAPAAGGIATAVRRLAGSAFRPHSWPSDPHGAATAAAAFVARVGFPADRDFAARIRIGVTPRAGAADGYCPSLPSRLILAAVAVADAEGVTPQPYLDRAFDLLAGLCLCNGSHKATMMGALSAHGFGFTMAPIARATERKLVALFAIDRRNATPRAGFVTRPQRSLHGAALRVLASQYAAEATDPSAAALDRARRVAAAVRLDPSAAAAGFGADETGEALALYARDAAATDDGSEAWARFSTAADQANPENPADPQSVTEANAEREADESRKAAEKANAGADRDDATAEESREESADRQRKAKAMKGAPKGRSKAEQAATEAAEAAALAQSASVAAEAAPSGADGVDTAESRRRHRAPRGVLLVD